MNGKLIDVVFNMARFSSFLKADHIEDTPLISSCLKGEGNDAGIFPSQYTLVHRVAGTCRRHQIAEFARRFITCVTWNLCKICARNMSHGVGLVELHGTCRSGRTLQDPACFCSQRSP